MKETVTEKILNRLQYLVLELHSNKNNRMSESVTDKMLLVIEEIKQLLTDKK